MENFKVKARRILSDKLGRPSLMDLEQVRLYQQQQVLQTEPKGTSGSKLVQASIALAALTAPSPIFLSAAAITGAIGLALSFNRMDKKQQQNYFNHCGKMIELRKYEDKFIERAVKNGNDAELAFMPIDEAATLSKSHPDYDQRLCHAARLQTMLRLGMIETEGKFPSAIGKTLTPKATDLLLNPPETFTKKEQKALLSLHEKIETLCVSQDTEKGVFCDQTRKHITKSFQAMLSNAPIPYETGTFFDKFRAQHKERMNGPKYIDVAIARLHHHQARQINKSLNKKTIFQHFVK